MASGSYAKRQEPQEPLDLATRIPPRATRQLPITEIEGPETATGIYLPRTTPIPRAVEPARPKARGGKGKQQKVIDGPHPLAKYRPWMASLIICMVIAVLFSAVLLSSAIMQRSDGPALLKYFGGQVYDVQVGGKQAGSWQSNQPLPTQVPIHQGPYSVLGKPSLRADFMNRVLADYHSPAAGKAQALYDLGAKYGIDPAFALAFFLHESTFGTAGEARKTLSLGNLRCIPNAACVDQDRGGYASFPTWEAGFEAWYKLIRNYYVAQRGLVTVDQIIPVYAPNADNNNEQGYIASLKHSIDTWKAGQLRP
ncbi:MAG: glucosaminidase domain-containing protein [Ktedonobacteraceae bacterium]|nr:glucosaminidase domain-containing protein [Ktedonobacteraceae bacterium]MBO0796718.1 glucosaminidase domain-containing protein [Ktedonobacteraceae bacterium]